MASEPRTLVVVAHPQLTDSRINAALAGTAASVDGVTVHELYAAYPDGRIDVAHDQRLLLQHDRVVLQFPFFWYSSPPLLKQWLDEVFEYGFAYGTGGTALHGKTLRVVTSAGGPRDSYRPDGFNRFPIPDLLRPFDATAELTGMRYEEPFLVYGVRTVGDAALADHQRTYRTLLETGALPAASRISPAGAKEPSLAA
ncbi:NAD(P)H-dependent oxidoreductase [Streptomyces zagrosensis]|uniref:Glutathione-regulated potassium-efflux system ancillary protein KefG n=1 Tax=Streptomyces zagrosensis TaxID=1042984 RepID=A0A7W9QBN3_9ACTN|nr:NAD(P)H-dependent oxidoreductase [Streptomyces zagrosensis]MBB5936939.1 glutathione-regulated potassium-efflux system ancillary protein KefG [Streptomyces zagrosensis]